MTREHPQTSGAEARVLVRLQRHGWKPCPSRIIYEISSQNASAVRAR